MGHYQNEHIYSENMQQTGPGRPQRPPLDNRRLRGARPCIRPQEGEVKSGGKCESSGAQQEEDVPACVICTGPLSIVAVGSCNHKDICARCSLLMRLNYDDIACPFCKTELSQVILTRWKPEGVPDFSELKGRSGTMWRKPAWARGVLVDNQSSSGGSPLSSTVQGITAVACPVCDEVGARPFRSVNLLQAHVKVEHGRSLCSICLSAKRRFPLELEAYSADDLAAHMAAEHPRCDFCNLHMYSGDELYEHMREQHFTCDICQRAGSFLHFTSSDALIGHLRSDHHLCEEAECVGCLIAFATPDELAQHRRERHSRAMPRFNRARARIMPLGLDAFPSRPLPTSPDRDRVQEQSVGRSQRPRSGGRGSSGSAARAGGRGRESAPQPRPAEEPSTSGGMVMIDDDLGMTGDAFPAMGPAASGSRQGSEARRHAQEEQGSEEFPSLQAAAQSASQANGHAPGGSAQTRPPALPSLQKVTVKCACGRRVSHIALPVGTAPKPIRCDAECERVQRSSRLADAFGIGDPGHHVPWVDRQRQAMQDAHYSPELLLYAWHNRAAVEDLERQLADFVADGAKKRASLAAAPKQARHIAHLLAEQYGLATQSFGAEPNRCVQLFKGAHAAVPRQALSRAAAGMPLEDLERAVRAEKGFPVHFTDVAPAADLHRILQRWEGQFVLSGPHADGSAAARFSRPEGAKEVLDALGGGVRGQYRINRAASTPAASAPAAVPQAHAGSTCAASASRPTAGHQSSHTGISSSGHCSSHQRPQPPRPSGTFVVSAKIDPLAIRASDMAFEESPASAKPAKTKPETRLPAGVLPGSILKDGTSKESANGAATVGQDAEAGSHLVAENWEDAADDGQE
ncbi:hypothetical protein COCSUDRAFT_46285 [Coccomyxa subellipsoidea C-169]|uniref:RING-type E3 ubiquitin transferase n=1 Tax=Coccomyxa subellipsoidea (strain C-169) TaxID=574566 RepID=I0Z8F6_COCSC|nr:hypothetical protein COCSUDRAFT_46285 [Coccomyxa subellipsoidea C-169]EIE26925.1 hypothetical protein COCSUDRAFT_46285 [Coccomyxa subellipsoidea C-169]|eukprot:XP_005651469.1 hypothetical protein COCSUDRAFT_46285 [Coccomyxa subellipsoidea C-169]